MTSLLKHTVLSQPNVDLGEKIPQNNTVLQKWGHAVKYEFLIAVINVGMH